MQNYPTFQERDKFFVPKIDILEPEMHKSTPGQKGRYLVEMLTEAGKAVLLSAVRHVLYRNGLKGNSVRRKPIVQKEYKKLDCSLKMHKRDKD